MDTEGVNMREQSGDIDVKAHFSLANGDYTLQNDTKDIVGYIADRDLPITENANLKWHPVKPGEWVDIAVSDTKTVQIKKGKASFVISEAT